MALEMWFISLFPRPPVGVEPLRNARGPVGLSLHALAPAHMIGDGVWCRGDLHFHVVNPQLICIRGTVAVIWVRNLHGPSVRLT